MNQAEYLQNNRFVRQDPEAQQEVDRKSLTWMMPPLQTLSSGLCVNSHVTHGSLALGL